MQMTLAPARPAATVVLIREDEHGLEVLLVRRHDSIAFMGGAHVFPGGRVDEADFAVQADEGALDLARMGDIEPSLARALYAAAARELGEEAGIDVPRGALIYFAHWVTPEIETRRFDTRFFLAAAPRGQAVRHDGVETTASVWIRPADAIARCQQGDIALPPPTWTTLRWLEPFQSVDAALAWGRQKPVPRVQPGFIQDGETRIVTLPGDAELPPIAGFTARETRFILSAGHWRPAHVVGDAGDR
jgi:8-oxo-dGTP pyrophosphatase MutT (NUDIX family)